MNYIVLWTVNCICQVCLFYWGKWRQAFFKGINLGTQNVQLETQLFTFLFASFFPLMSWNLFRLVLWEISLVFINISCLQGSRMCESETVPILHFPFFLVHSHLLSILLSILLLLISCKNMYSSHRMAPRGNFNTLIYISEVCISHFYKTILQYDGDLWMGPRQTEISKTETNICHPSASQKSHVLKKAVFLQLKIEVERRKWRRFLTGYH